jgi:hypothetical protein
MRRLPILVLLLVASAACANGSAGDGAAGIEGRVTIGPQCPVEQMGSPCPDAPYAGRITVTAHGDTVAEGTSGSDGRFRIALAPGTYTVVAGPEEGQTIGVGTPVDVVVVTDAFTHVDLSVDSGIR